MRVLRGLGALAHGDFQRGCVATVGVFDGVHLGHLTVLKHVVARAKDLDATPTMVTFSGHPKNVLLGHAPAKLTSLEHRLRLFKRYGIETTLVLEFNEAIRVMSAVDFVRTVLLDGLGLRELVFGFDSKFGHDRQGTPSALAPIAAKWGFTIDEVEPVRLAGRAVSSTAIREAVQLGDLDAARAMLSRPFSVLGTVVHGDKRGRDLGFPTANLDPHHEILPPRGVYAAATVIEGQLVPAVLNLGRRPTFDGSDLLIETHILDWQGDLYDRNLEVFFLQHLRGELKFDDAEALKGQIAKDVGNAKKIWREAGLDSPAAVFFPPYIRADSSVGRATD
ncbi:MAG: bifunctional riboflavin kinase/FAD synthetase [Planctomycetes bacterium]|nr:bifunctional riboflavin kinase/FAD synthetase [Planctomycetota bacterium]